MTAYYSLRCASCEQDFPPLLATTPEELTRPDFDEVSEQAGESNADRLRAFHAAHSGPGHKLETVKLQPS